MTPIAVVAADGAPTVAARSSSRRRIAGYAGIAAGLLAIAAAGAAVTGAGWSGREPLDPESAGPSGTRALVRILEDHGVDVRVSRDRASAAAALASAERATLVLPDAPFLSDETLTSLTAAADDVLLVEPRSHTLDLLLSGSSPAGAATDESIPAGCPLPVAQRAGAILTGALFHAGDGVQSCYRTDDGSGLLVQDGRGGTAVSALDGLAVLSNGSLAREGNAALALGLTGRHPVLVWYVPSLTDADAADSAPTVGELTPPWVSPAIVLLGATALAAALWRGRRFGPLVAENLPVTVRGSETTEGRARLYARSRDAPHALAQLRAGALERLGRLLGLGPSASATAIADAAAERLGADRAEVRGILLDRVPANDHDLLDAYARLRTLEARVSDAVRPERKTT